MTHTSFDPESHPRNATSGRFAEVQHTAPDAILDGRATRPADAQEAIDALTGGREVLEREVRSGVFDYTALVDARSTIWERAGGPRLPAWKLEGHINAVNTDITANNVEQVLEVAYYRAASGRHTVAAGGELRVTPVDDAELRAADRLAEGRSRHVEEMWNNGQEVGPESEISDHAARLFAEEALQNRPPHLPITVFPRLAEFAYQPYTEASGASPAKIDALHTEIRRLGEGQGYLPSHKQLRHDTLATFATHALPGQP